MKIDKNEINEIIQETNKLINKPDKINFTFISEYEKEKFSDEFDYENYIYLFTNSYIIGRNISNYELAGDSKISLDIYRLDDLRRHIKIKMCNNNAMVVDLGEFSLIATGENINNLNTILKEYLLK